MSSIGGRGRGPGEFQEMEFMELTPEGHLAIMDRRSLQYKILSIEGEFIQSYSYNLENQFYPTQILYEDGKLLGLFLDHNPLSEIDKFKRDLFHVYSTDFQHFHYSFLPFHSLELNEGYAWEQMMLTPGSFDLIGDQNRFVYAPGIYFGKLYLFEKTEDGKWNFIQALQGIKPS